MSRLFIFLGLLTGAARAQEDERPLAIPGGDEAPADAPAVAEPPSEAAAPAPAAPAPMSAAHLQALRQYRQRRLVIRGERERHGGSSYVVGYGDPYWGGWRTATVLHDPGYVVRTWGIYQGLERLAVPTFLGKVGEAARQGQLEARVRRSRNAARAWYVVAGVGGAGLVAGLVGMKVADTDEQLRAWNNVTFGGSLVGIGGLITGSFPASRSRRLERYPAATFDLEEALQLVDSYNDRLAQDLGISPEEAWRIEAPGRDR